MFKDKKLLVLTHTYNSFIKDPIEESAKYFEKVYVLVRHQPIAELGNIIPLNFFKSRRKYSKKYAIDLKGKPDNVEVILVPLWYLPFNFVYKMVGKLHARKVLSIIKKKNISFDLIHAHFAWSAGYAGMKVKEEYNKPLVITGHGYDIYDLPFRDEGWKNRLGEVLSSADELITVSEYNRECIKDLGIKKDITVLPNGYSTNLFYPKEVKEDFDYRDRDIILSIGNLEEIKGYDILIKALSKVVEKKKNILLLHIGEGSKVSEIKDLVEELGLGNYVKFLGRRPHSELVEYFAVCKIFVSPSRFEGNPTVMFETLACGKPFIGTLVGGVPDIIDSLKYGKLAPPEDSDKLAENIVWALENKWDEKEILEKGEQYSWKKIVKKILKIYEKLI